MCYPNINPCSPKKSNLVVKIRDMYIMRKNKATSYYVGG